MDIAEAVPELVPPARRTVRLHLRLGGPTVRDGSVGGSLLWRSLGQVAALLTGPLLLADVEYHGDCVPGPCVLHVRGPDRAG
ncbi:hypothetical protein [Kitasatospora sp. NPDC057541]|uniref:hypothetical protein n=1 Tax=unclassified Kitasatospora TaxID=2633591 RepID=UPI00368878DD